MEYERTEDGQIQADFAARVGQVLLQYDHLKEKLAVEQQFEATLTICLLQSMLTQCQQLLDRLHYPDRAPYGLDELVEMANRDLGESPPLLGLSKDCIQEIWPSSKGIKYRDLIEYIRNALSHPLPQTDMGFARTGFITQRSDSGAINYFIFTASPWVDHKGNLESKWKAKSINPKNIQSLQDRLDGWVGKHGVVGVELKKQSDGWVLPTLYGQLFVPVIRIQLDVFQLRTFLLALSDYLSAPLCFKTHAITN
jgi:hypothetical protein